MSTTRLLITLCRFVLETCPRFKPDDRKAVNRWKELKREFEVYQKECNIQETPCEPEYAKCDTARPCQHVGEYGTHCSFCGHRIKGNCNHHGEYGCYCGRCGVKFNEPLSPK